MQLRQSERKQAKIKLAIQGCAGSGKTYSSLLLAFGLTNQWRNIGIIDSENGSADLYAHLGQYNVLNLNNNYSPENYIEAIEICEKAGMEVIIIDSLSQSWDFLLEYHSGLSGNSFTNWGKITPRQNALIQKILQSKAHEMDSIYANSGVELSLVVCNIDRKVDLGQSKFFIFEYTSQLYREAATKIKYIHTKSDLNDKSIGISLNNGRSWTFLTMNNDTPNILRLRFSEEIVNKVMGY